ncbi:unnamed protein product [Sympodiomycopsis kandeliae]
MLISQTSRSVAEPVNPLQKPLKNDLAPTFALAPLPAAYANDPFKLDQLPEDILEAVDFWAERTPQDAFIKAPRGENAFAGFETINWSEFAQLRNITASRLIAEFGLTVPADMASPRGDRCITFLVSPTHEVITPWLALASMGYSVQFISAVHQPHIVASLIERSGAKGILHANMDSAWLEQVLSEVAKLSLPRQPKVVELTKQNRLVALVDQLRASTATQAASVQLHQKKPEPFVYLHSFGSTSAPKLYPLPLFGANLSAKDSAFHAHLLPLEKRWRCQMQTSLAFHFSFQNPVWRALKCGTALAFPVIDPATKADRAQKLVPNAADILNTLVLSGSDLLYCSPNGLQAMLETSIGPNAPGVWRDAVQRLKQAHTGAAPVSREKADCYERHGLLVFQVFALTETGLMFYARKDITGDTTWLKPLEGRKQYMLFHQKPGTDIYELWLKDSFPGLLNQSVKFEPYPGDNSITAWNTSDTFRKLPAYGPHDDLVSFAGRQDDWIRCTHGTAARGLELEEALLKDLRTDLGYDAIKAVTFIGNGKAALGAVVELPRAGGKPTLEETASMEKSTRYINEKLLQYPAVIKPSNVIFTGPEEPVRMTQKGSIMRSQNELIFGPILDKLIAAA